MCGRAHFTNVVERVQLGKRPTVYAQELFVHDRGKWEGAARQKDSMHAS